MTCSICLINRQGPCRKYWLKFERCMKEHGREKEERRRRGRRKGEDDDGLDGGGEAGPRGIATKNVDTIREGDHDGQNNDWPSRATMEGEWDKFMEKSTTPREDEEEEEEEEEDGGGDDDDDKDSDTENAMTEPAVMVEDISD
jgi:hypothetical protein